MIDPREVTQDTGAVGGSVPDDTHGIATRGREMTDEAPVSGQRQGPAVPSGRVQCAEVGARVPVSLADPREVEALCECADEWARKQRGHRDGDDIERVKALADALRALVAERDALTAQLAAARADVERLQRDLPTCGVCDNGAALIVIGSQQRSGKERPVRMARCATCWEKMNQGLYRTVPLISAIDAAKGAHPMVPITEASG